MIKRRNRRRLLGAGTALFIGLCPTTPFALTVFDPLNYEQNLLSAIRSLDAVQNQIRR